MKQVPSVVYRYRPFHAEFLEKEIRDREIYFCQLDRFNDPYEGRLRMNLKSDHEMFVAFLKFLAAGPSPTEQDIQRSIKVFGFERTMLMERIRKMTATLEPHEFDRTAKYLASIPGMQPLVGGLNESEDLLRRNTVVACFTELKNDPAMFGHYAGLHRGVCLEYETALAREFHPVRYSEQIPEISADQMSAGIVQIIRDFALTKSTHWEREREWRIIYHPFPPKALNTHGMVLRRVYVGIAATRETRELIGQWCSASAYSSVEYHDLKLSPGGYELVD